MSKIDALCGLFASQSGDYRLLTFRSDDPKHQRVDFINSLCRRISDTYFIVRESDKKKVGWHFHAIVKVLTEPPARWFIKNVHMHFVKIGSTQTSVGRVMPLPNLSKREIAEMLHFEPDRYDEVSLGVCQAEFLKIVKKRRMARHLDKCCNYLLKELPELPVQYVDYIMVRSKKNLPLP